MKYCIFNNNTGFIHGFCNKAEDVETFKINFSKLQEQIGNDIIVNPTRDLINLLVDTSFQ